MNTTSSFITIVGLTLSLLISFQIVWADSDSITAKHLLDAGKIQPLELILKKVRPTYPGTIIEVELEQEDNVIIYEIEILQADGVVMELIIDATTGQLLRSEIED